MNKSPKPFMEFQITRKCNYFCEYCTHKKDNLNQERYISANDEVVNEFIKFIHTLDEQWTIELIGGEALTHPRFLEVAQEIISAGHKLKLTTNFSFSIEKYKQLSEICGENLIGLSASLHLSQVKSIDDFISKAVKFNNYKNQKTKFRILSVMTEQDFDILKKIKRQFENHNIELNFLRLRNDGIGVKYNKNIEKYLNKDQNNLAIVFDKINNQNLNGVSCYAGCKLLQIMANGNVNKCFTKQEGYFLGNLTQENVKMYNTPMPCSATECKCYPTIYYNNMIQGKLKPIKSPIKIIIENIKQNGLIFYLTLLGYKILHQMKKHKQQRNRKPRLIRNITKLILIIIFIFLI